MIEGFQEFEFDLPEALLEKLVQAFDQMEAAPLLYENVIRLPEAQGVYQLLYDGKIVYIGKTDAEAGLCKRLGRHAWTTQHRCNLDSSLVMFRALRVFVFTAIDLETQLIRHYGGVSKVAWNKSGFGSNDPGRERDTTKIKPGGFDELYPIDLDRRLNLLVPDEKEMNVVQVLDVLRNAVPYIIRSQRAPGDKSKPHPELFTPATMRSGATTAREVMLQVIGSLPSGWQATLLPGRIILYREDRHYADGAVIARS